MKKILVYVLFIVVIEALGFSVGMMTREGTQIYAETINKPPLSPPGILFPIAWTILYGLMGFAGARIFLAQAGTARNVGLALFAVQLVLNLAWCFIFFGARNFGAALVELICMLVAVVAMVFFFWKCDHVAALSQIPYILWLCFATYLNAGVVMLN